ncbi:MAG TPA: hypothetical protein VLJ37_06960 [bacterium]|nr:hypothetical protein [bacterium]
MNPLNILAQQQLTSHITAWAQIPASLTANSPIPYSNGGGLGLSDRLDTFVRDVRVQERALLAPLNVGQALLDEFLAKNGQFRVLFWQLSLPWVSADRPRASRVMSDLETLSTSLRALENAIAGWNAPDLRRDEDALAITIGRNVNLLRRVIAPRASLAEEILPLVSQEPAEAVTIFYDDAIRSLRQFDSLTVSMELYHSRRPSWRP